MCGRAFSKDGNVDSGSDGDGPLMAVTMVTWMRTVMLILATVSDGRSHDGHAMVAVMVHGRGVCGVCDC